MIDSEYRSLNFDNWQIHMQDGNIPILAVSGTQIVILRWDLTSFTDQKALGAGLLELTVHSVQQSPDYQKDFGMVRVAEILGGRSDMGGKRNHI